MKGTRVSVVIEPCDLQFAAHNETSKKTVYDYLATRNKPSSTKEELNNLQKACQKIWKTCSQITNIQTKGDYNTNVNRLFPNNNEVDELRDIPEEKSLDVVVPCNKMAHPNKLLTALPMRMQANILVEVDNLKQVRIRSFSHWPHRSSPSSSQMIQAGFFNCNVGDRVICIYCNLICQQWAPNNEDPYEVHKTLSPKCVYVNAMLTSSAESISPLSIINEASSMTNINSMDSHTIVHTAACNPNYIEIPKRTASFVNWLNENAPSVDDLVKAGFFFTGTKTVVTCFYCNGSLQNWGANDNPTIEHARWFPHCAYAKQLCGTELYQKIQESKRILQERARVNNTNGQSNTSSRNMDVGRLLIPDESTLSRLVAARLDLPISQRLLDRNFKLSIVKRCWEDQLRLKQEDFKSDCDLLMACTVLRKQIEKIDGKKENIIVPSVAMKKIREKEQADAKLRLQAAADIRQNDDSRADTLATYISMNQDVTMIDLSEVDRSKMEISKEVLKIGKAEERKPIVMKKENSEPEKNLALTNPCVLCHKEEKRLACIPCGHLATCTGCGQSVRSCPVCRQSVEAFVRVYL